MHGLVQSSGSAGTSSSCRSPVTIWSTGVQLSTVYISQVMRHTASRNLSRLSASTEDLPMRNRTLPWRAISRLALPALVALSAQTLATVAHAQSKVVAAISSDVATLDPTIYHAIISFHARLNIFDALTDIGPDSSASFRDLRRSGKRARMRRLGHLRSEPARNFTTANR